MTDEPTPTASDDGSTAPTTGSSSGPETDEIRIEVPNSALRDERFVPRIAGLAAAERVTLTARTADDPDFLAAESPFDPERFEDRFELLIEGENLLSYERIHDALGTWPQSVWSVGDKPETRWAWREHPLVFVPK